MKFFVFAGELSADNHGARLISALKKKDPHLEFCGVAGPEMRSQQVNAILQMEDFSVMGFSDVLRSLPRLWKQFRQIRNYILKENPNVVIFIDSPSLSLRMAPVLRQKGYKGKIVQYISPTVWAWGKDRVHKMAANFDLLLTTYPFEAAYYAHTPLQVEYVGNPVQEAIQKYSYDSQWAKLFGIKKTNHLIALFPGSRPAEILRNLPPQLQAIKFMQRKNTEMQVAISCAQEASMALVQKILLENEIKNGVLVSKPYSYDLMRTAHSAIAKSGTVTLELALHQCPTVVTYKLTLLNRLIAKYVLKVKLPFYCIVNILGGREIFPELIEKECTPQEIYEHLMRIDQEGTVRAECIDACQTIQNQFRGDEASERAAEVIMFMPQ
jgi:lipid-A-disaccharide synthase